MGFGCGEMGLEAGGREEEETVFGIYNLKSYV